MTDSIKKLLMKKENIYKSYVRNGYTAEDRARLKAMQKLLPGYLKNEIPVDIFMTRVIIETVGL